MLAHTSVNDLINIDGIGSSPCSLLLMMKENWIFFSGFNLITSESLPITM